MEPPSLKLKEVLSSPTTPPSSSSVQIAPLQICRSYAKHGICALPGTCIYDHPPAIASGSAPSPQSVAPVTSESSLAPAHAWEAAGQYFEPASTPVSQEVCQAWIQTGSCSYGNCQFSHPPLSVQFPPKYSLHNNPPPLQQLQSQYSIRSQHIHEQSRASHSSHTSQLSQQLPPLAAQLSQPLPNLDYPQKTIDSQRLQSQQYQLQRPHKSFTSSPHGNQDQSPQSSQGPLSAIASKSAPKKLLCKNWNKGCKFGDGCRFYHPRPETTFDHLFKQSPPRDRDDEDDYYDDYNNDSEGYSDYARDYSYDSTSKPLAHLDRERLSANQQYQPHIMQRQQNQLQQQQLRPQMQQPLPNQQHQPSQISSQMPQLQHMVQQLQPLQLQMQSHQLQSPYQQQFPQVQSPQYQYQTPYQSTSAIQPMVPQLMSMQSPQQSDMYATQPPMQTHVYQSHLHEIHVSHQPQDQLHQLQQQLLQQQLQQQQMQQQLQIQQQQLQQQIQQQLQQKQQKLLQDQFQLMQLTSPESSQDQSLFPQLSLTQPMVMPLPLLPQPQSHDLQAPPVESEQEPQQPQPTSPSKTAPSKSQGPQQQRGIQAKYKPKNSQTKSQLAKQQQTPSQQQQQTTQAQADTSTILERKHDTSSPQQSLPTTEGTAQNEINGNGAASSQHANGKKKKKKKKKKQNANQEKQNDPNQPPLPSSPHDSPSAKGEDAPTNTANPINAASTNTNQKRYNNHVPNRKAENSRDRFQQQQGTHKVREAASSSDGPSPSSPAPPSSEASASGEPTSNSSDTSATPAEPTTSTSTDPSTSTAKPYFKKPYKKFFYNYKGHPNQQHNRTTTNTTKTYPSTS